MTHEELQTLRQDAMKALDQVNLPVLTDFIYPYIQALELQYSLLRNHHIAFADRLIDSFGNDEVELTSGPPPADPAARGWYEQSLKSAGDYLK